MVGELGIDLAVDAGQTSEFAVMFDKPGTY